MGWAVLRLTRILVIVALLAVPFTPPAATRAADRDATRGEAPVSGIYPEVRLRKLHLVRPDLIPYPIAFEVCC